MKPSHYFACCALILSVAACVPASEHVQDINAGRDAQDKLTLGTVQRELRVGMSGADVVSAFGSPNVVTTDGQRRETWVYDRIATERVYSSSAGGVSALFLAGASAGSGASQTSQRTLTVIVYFDEMHRVRDFSYRSSSF